ncbi:Cof-type HAD-IIB family hydrolase [Culicoidibacter larvae]|uniref:Cof-type HAD-IIB family hydrolase n=1 Tax=Culicoidibacter larvae TaxID=2579976 RepID=A0A5R8Q9E2_9FIRM|nr:Cof-type HAD-IIB family hydrolase [Culicoidibacter larvae]TLG72536.1 Cof-type HAD-IIB family hydrolase [Culicoidibacter larvae]
MNKLDNIKIVFFDIDDTLTVKNMDNYLPPSVAVALEKLQQKGIDIAIASGRAKYGVIDAIRALNFDTFVMINGNYVEHHGEVLYSNPLPVEEIERFIAWCNDNGVGYGFTGSEACAVSERSDWVIECLDPIYYNAIVDAEFYRKHPVYQMWTFSDKPLEELIPTDEFPDLKFVRWHPYSMDVFSSFGSKANGIDQVLKKMNIDAKDAMAFGDELNDREMFKKVGFAVAMGVAHPELVELADFQTKNVEDDGILYALQTLGVIE